MDQLLPIAAGAPATGPPDAPAKVGTGPPRDPSEDFPSALEAAEERNAPAPAKPGEGGGAAVEAPPGSDPPGQTDTPPDHHVEAGEEAEAEDGLPSISQSIARPDTVLPIVVTLTAPPGGVDATATPLGIAAPQVEPGGGTAPEAAPQATTVPTTETGVASADTGNPPAAALAEVVPGAGRVAPGGETTSPSVAAGPALVEAGAPAPAPAPAPATPVAAVGDQAGPAVVTLPGVQSSQAAPTEAATAQGASPNPPAAGAPVQVQATGVAAQISADTTAVDAGAAAPDALRTAVTTGADPAPSGAGMDAPGRSDGSAMRAPETAAGGSTATSGSAVSAAGLSGFGPTAPDAPAVSQVARPVDPASLPATDQITGAVRLLRLSGREEIRLRLDPPELGAVRVQLVERDGGISVLLRAEQALSADLIRQALPQLREALENAQVVVSDLGASLGETSDFAPGHSGDGQAEEGPSGTDPGTSADEAEEAPLHASDHLVDVAA